MAMAVHITVDSRACNLQSAIEEKVAEWPESKCDAFLSKWEELERAGAELAEVQVFGLRVVAYPSPDFTAYCADWGIYPSA